MLTYIRDQLTDRLGMLARVNRKHFLSLSLASIGVDVFGPDQRDRRFGCIIYELKVIELTNTGNPVFLGLPLDQLTHRKVWKRPLELSDSGKKDGGNLEAKDLVRAIIELELKGKGVCIFRGNRRQKYISVGYFDLELANNLTDAR